VSVSLLKKAADHYGGKLAEHGPTAKGVDWNYADPVKMFDACLSRCGRSVALLQDYGLYEFTLIVRHPAE
jgi:hypothetical protein